MQAISKYKTLALAVLAALVFGVFIGSSRAEFDSSSFRAKVGALILDDNFTEAETLAKRWLAGAERSSNQSLDVSDALEALTRIYAGLKRYEDADASWRRCLEMRLKSVGEKHALIAQTLDVMAGIYIERGMKAEAQALWREGLAAYRKQPPVAALAGQSNPPDSSHRKVPELIQQGRASEAEDELRRSGDRAALATFLLDRGHTEEAAAEHRRLLDEAPTADRALNTATLYRQRKFALFEQEFLQRAVSIQERTVGPFHNSLIPMLGSLTASFEREGELARAYAPAKRASSIAAAARVRQTYTTPFAVAVEMRRPHLDFLRVASHLQQVQPAQAATIAQETFEAGQLAAETVISTTLSQMGLRLSQGSGRLSELIRQRQDLEREWQGLDRMLLTAITGAASQIERDNLRGQIEANEQKLALIDARLRKDFPQYFEFGAPAPLSVANVQAMLGDTEAAVQFVTAGEEVYIWVVTKSAVRWVSAPLKTSEIEEMVVKLRCGLDREEWEGIEKPARCQRLLGIGKSREGEPLPFNLRIAYELYRKLFNPVERLIDGKELLIVPTGALTSLPFQVLVTEAPAEALPAAYAGYRGVAWLGRRQPLSVLPSVSSLKALRRDAGRSRAAKAYAAWGNPKLKGDPSCPKTDATPIECSAASADARLSRGRRRTRSADAAGVLARGVDLDAVRREVLALCPLPDTASEIRCVSEGQIEPRVRLGEDATLSDIESLNRTGELSLYRILHFATHGLLSGDVQDLIKRKGEPALVLTPSEGNTGLLEASQIAKLNLNADWVILSACNTAASEKPGAEALSGLARAFFYAGARAILVSHWPVYSDAAASLITNTFDAMGRNATAGRAQALRAAITRLMDDESSEDNSHPSVWAPFSLVGEGGRFFVTP